MAETAGEKEHVEARLRTLESKINALETHLERSKERAQRAEAAADRAEERVDELETEVSALRDRTSLLDRVARAATLKPDEKAIVLVQTLYAEASKKGRHEKQQAKASLDADAAVKALGGEADRTSMYGDTGLFARAEELVDDPTVLRFITESRASQMNTRLVMDLEDGEAPTSIQGHEIAGGVDV